MTAEGLCDPNGILPVEGFFRTRTLKLPNDTARDEQFQRHSNMTDGLAELVGLLAKIAVDDFLASASSSRSEPHPLQEHTPNAAANVAGAVVITEIDHRV